MKIDKAIFLDIDGVLALIYGFSLPESEWLWGTAYPFDKQCVAVLNIILERTDAEIVLSSAWRTDYNLEELHEIFVWNKVSKSPIVTTEYFGGFSRCKEIETFLLKNSVKKFIIIDDMELDCYPKQFIHTTMEKGLHSGLVAKIVGLLE